MSNFKEKLNELKAQVNSLDNLSMDIKDAQDFKKFYDEYWPKIKDVLEFVKERKVTRKRADKKLQEAIVAGDKVLATLNDPAKLSASLKNFGELLDEIESKIDKVISTLVFIDKLFKEDTDFDNLLEKTVEFLTKVNNILDDLDEKVKELNASSDTPNT